MGRIVSALLVLTVNVPLFAGTDASRVRAAYMAVDYETADRLGTSLWSSNDPELQAWTLAARARTTSAHSGMAADAQKLVDAHPESAWSWFGLASVLFSVSEEVKGSESASAKMMALAEDAAAPEMIAVRAQALYQANRKDEAFALLDQALARRAHDPILLVMKASLLPADKQMAVFEEARKADPAFVQAWARPGSLLVQRRQVEEGYALLKQAAALSPRSISVHRGLWRAIAGLKDKTADEKAKMIEEDMAALEKLQPDEPRLWLAIANTEHELHRDAQGNAAEERILRDAPSSVEAEWVLFERAGREARNLGSAGPDDPTGRARTRELYRAFIDQPHHRNKELLGDAYTTLFGAMRFDPTVPVDELVAAAEGLEKYETANVVWRSAFVPIALADRGTHLDYAEKLARDGFTEVRNDLENNHALFRSEGEYQGAVDAMEAASHDALGWVLFKRGKLDAAKKELLAAREGNPKSALVDLHLGRFYESQGLLAEAEESYRRGALVTNDPHNQNPEALKALYEKRHGSLEGWDAYFQHLDQSDTELRKKSVLASRLAAPKNVLPFRLKSLDGSTLASADLPGKVTVINFWGVWCGWCVREMPDFQKLVKQYANDPAVRVITIDSDTDPDKVRRWMAEKRYAFPVLMDDGWIARAGMSSYPTTWFLDREGRLAFEKQGWSEKLVEEFSWRIEALK